MDILIFPARLYSVAIFRFRNEKLFIVQALIDSSSALFTCKYLRVVVAAIVLVLVLVSNAKYTLTLSILHPQGFTGG